MVLMKKDFLLYQEELALIEERINNGLLQHNFASSITDLQRCELKTLLSNLQHLLEDKLQFNILNNTIGTVLNQKIIKRYFKSNL